MTLKLRLCAALCQATADRLAANGHGPHEGELERLVASCFPWSAISTTLAPLGELAETASTSTETVAPPLVRFRDVTFYGSEGPVGR